MAEKATDARGREKRRQDAQAAAGGGPPGEQATAPSVRISDKQFEYLMKCFELYSNVQVQADTIYYQRTSVITLTIGLLFVGYSSVKDAGAGTLISAVGVVLCFLWFLFEQRNLIFFEGRGHVLLELEKLLLRTIEEDNGDQIAFFPFWSTVPGWVKANARVYQRFSAQLIQRVLVPCLFLVLWLCLLLAEVLKAGWLLRSS